MKTILCILALAACLFAASTGVITLGTLTAIGTTAAVEFKPPAVTATPSRHTVQVIVTGGPTACAIQLEGSLDAATASSPTWGNLSGSQDCKSSVMFHVADRPVRAVRANLTALSGGTSPAVSVKYVGVE